MALFAPKLNLADVRLEYTQRIDAVAYPCIRQSAPSGKMTSGEPEEYVYCLKANVKSHYRSEGHLHCPGVDVALTFMFQTENPLEPNHRLALGNGVQQASVPLAMGPFYLLQHQEIGEPERRKEIADL